MGNNLLLEQIKIRNTVMRNRIVMAPMEARLNMPDGGVSKEMVEYYKARAHGGAGAVIIENTYIDEFSSRSGIISSGFYSDHMIAGKSLLADAIREEGALAIMQLSHGGPQANPAANHSPVLYPSLYTVPAAGKEYQVLTEAQIGEIEDSFAQASRRACWAGFNGVEFHAAHGYLLSSFLSPLRNQREDQYGGSVENRARILIEVLKKARKNVDCDFILGVRMNISDGLEGGMTEELAAETAKLIAPYVDYINLSAGFSETCGKVMITPCYVDAPTLASQIRNVYQEIKDLVPVFGVGALDYKSGEECLEQDCFDAAVFGRAFIADPDWPNKLSSGEAADIRPCCRGNEGCFSRMLKGLPVRCELNPAAGQEEKYQLKKAKKKKRIIVVGGGTAGMECARIGALQGHEMVLFESSGRLGGHLNEAGVPAFKAGLRRFMEWQIRQMKKLNVNVRLNRRVSAEEIQNMQFDHVIVAVGSNYIVPPIKGVERAIKPDCYDTEQMKDKYVAVIGGGMVGAETALHLSGEKVKGVAVLEMRDAIAPEHDPVARQILADKLEQNGVKVLLGCRASAIEEERILYLDENGETKEVRAEAVILATGLRADSEQVSAFRKLPNAVCVGDCIKAGKVYHATHEAWKVMLNL